MACDHPVVVRFRKKNEQLTTQVRKELRTFSKCQFRHLLKASGRVFKCPDFGVAFDRLTIMHRRGGDQMFPFRFALLGAI